MSEAEASHLYSGNAAFVEQLYEAYLENPGNVEQQWREYFDSLQNGQSGRDIPHSPVQQAFYQAAKKGSNPFKHR